METVVIIGSGPAGLTAGIYTARADLKPLLYEGVMAGGPPGGQLTQTSEIENFPGFPEGITGVELMMRMKEQYLRHGGRILSEDIAAVDLSKSPFTITGGATAAQARVLIIATGATARRLGLPGEKRLWSRGISACAVCDGGLPCFRNRELAVVGGGDTAAEEALYLANFASRVHLIHRRDRLRASAAMQARVANHPKIVIHWDTVPEDVLGETKVEGVRLKNLKSGQAADLPCAGLFYAIGHTPNTAFLSGQLPVDPAGYLVTMPGSTQTRVRGVFACGDVQDPRYRQAVSAAGSGCMAALDAQRFLEE